MWACKLRSFKPSAKFHSKQVPLRWLDFVPQCVKCKWVSYKCHKLHENILSGLLIYMCFRKMSVSKVVKTSWVNMIYADDLAPNMRQAIYKHNAFCVITTKKHDDVIKWKHFPRNWPFVWGIHRSPVNSPHKGQWRGALIFSLICVWINDWVNNREAGDFRRYRAHYDVIVTIFCGLAVTLVDSG